MPSRRRQHQHRRSSVKPAPIRLLAVPGRASLWHVQQHREGNPSRPVSSRSSHRFNWCLRLAGRPPPDLGVGFCPSDKTRRAMSLRRLSRTCRLIAYNVLARVCVHNNYTLHDACRCRCRLRFSEDGACARAMAQNYCGMTPATAFGARPEACHWLHPPLAGS